MDSPCIQIKSYLPLPLCCYNRIPHIRYGTNDTVLEAAKSSIIVLRRAGDGKLRSESSFIRTPSPHPQGASLFMLSHRQPLSLEGTLHIAAFPDKNFWSNSCSNSIALFRPCTCDPVSASGPRSTLTEVSIESTVEAC